MRFALVVLVSQLATIAASAADPVDLALVTRIRDEGLRRSQVMSYAAHLSDHIGPRLTGSPQMKAANEWTRDTLTEIGLENARLEPYRFGRGWSWSRCVLELTGERAQPLVAIPQAWTAGTNGPVEGEVTRLAAETPDELATYKGKLAGKFVLLSAARAVVPRLEAPFRRYSADDLQGEARFEIPKENGADDFSVTFPKRIVFRRALDAFLAEEGALGVLEVGSRDGGIVRVMRGGEPVDPAPMKMPAVTLMTEHYNRLVRLVAAGESVRLRLDVGARFHENDGLAFNTVAEIPGRGKADELVIVGAHLDSYHHGTGAADNAAGVAIMMEAVRIVKALGIEPKRTVRICLWSGEEQGLQGSRAWVDQQLASRPPWPESEMTLPRSMRKKTGPLSFKPAHGKVSVYFNADHGGGRIRGIYLEGNSAARPIFEAWLAPLRDLGVTTVSLNKTGRTDHVSFDATGVPGFQFIQDPMDYFSQTHHSNLDTFDHLHSEDLRQAAVIVATLLVHAANRDEMIPRKPRPEN